MRRSSFLWLTLVTAATASSSSLAASCAMTSSDCSFDGTCASATSGPDSGIDAGADANTPDVQVPADCKEAADAKSAEAAACVDDSFAVFVDGASGSDTAAGTKSAPMKSLGLAVAKASAVGKRRLYMCGSGPYAEQVKLTQRMSLYGGFACGTWTYDGTKARIAPTAPGYALEVESVSAQITISDVELIAHDADPLAFGTSSIAVFANKSSLSFVRATIEAGVPAVGAPGAPGEKGVLTAVSSGAMTFAGNNASGTSLGAAKTCTCSTGGQSKGGTGGGASGGPGGVGTPNLGGAAPINGAGGAGAAACGGGGGTGNDGAPAPDASSALKITGRGVLDMLGWKSASGNDAVMSGAPGQGGGGGGGLDDSNAGGGGGCGSCGSSPGKGGGGGGASIAVALVDTSMQLVESVLKANAGGAGGPGGSGGPVDDAGLGGLGQCGGGRGGKGGRGGGGGGGAGGLSLGILYSGTAPTLDGATTGAITTALAGTKGTGGKAGENDGPDGVAGPIKNVTEL